MKAYEAPLLKLLDNSFQFRIPIYQRNYSWTEKECRQLWVDILDTGTSANVNAHFVGSIVYISAGLYLATRQAPLLVIDGQQRLTTVTILLAALAEAVGEKEPVDGFSARKIRSYFLLNTEETDDRRYKLLLSQLDRKTLISIVDGRDLPENSSYNLTENLDLFRRWIEELAGDFKSLCQGLQKLIVVDIALEQGNDNPHRIFESLNSTGRELSQADLIRNFILMELDEESQRKIYENYWFPMETDFGQQDYVAHFDSLMRHYLTVKTGSIPRLREVYETFKAYSQSENVASEAIEDLVKDIKRYSSHYRAMALGRERESKLRSAFFSLRELDINVAYPFLLELYQDYTLNLLCKEDLLEILTLTESYIFRRAVCDIPTNSLGLTFSRFLRGLNKEDYLGSIRRHFASLPAYRRFPQDEEFRDRLRKRDMYNFKLSKYWLRRFENFKRKEPVGVEDYSIEHILPQQRPLPEPWQTDLGSDWERIQQEYLHTIGNLTLTGYNSEYSARRFSEKRDIDGGFKISPLKVNEGLGQLTRWGEAEIKERRDRLVSLSVEVWPVPAELQGNPQTFKDTVAPKVWFPGDCEPPQEMRHPLLDSDWENIVNNRETRACRLLRSPWNKPLFAALRMNILSLGIEISENFRENYVSYSAGRGERLYVNPKSNGIQFEKHDLRGVYSESPPEFGNLEGDWVKMYLDNLKDLPRAVLVLRRLFREGR